MFLLKLIGKIVLIPIMLALTLIQWIGIASLAFRLASVPEALKMIAAGFVIFMVPVIGEWFVGMITAVNAGLRAFIRS